MTGGCPRCTSMYHEGRTPKFTPRFTYTSGSAFPNYQRQSIDDVFSGKCRPRPRPPNAPERTRTQMGNGPLKGLKLSLDNQSYTRGSISQCMTLVQYVKKKFGNVLLFVITVVVECIVRMIAQKKMLVIIKLLQAQSSRNIFRKPLHKRHVHFSCG